MPDPREYRSLVCMYAFGCNYHRAQDNLMAGMICPVHGTTLAPMILIPKPVVQPKEADQ